VRREAKFKTRLSKSEWSKYRRELREARSTRPRRVATRAFKYPLIGSFLSGLRHGSQKSINPIANHVAL
jgi:hypothetical protein